jgi:hypothetical protein
MSESGEILFNSAEAEVLGTAPVRPRTVLLAKSLSLFGYSLLLALALNVFACVFGLALSDARPWFPAVHLASTIFMTAFCSAVIVFAGALTVRLASRERLESVLTWVQVVLSISMVMGYQIVPNLIRRSGLRVAEDVGRLFYLPPAWFAGFDTLLAGSGPRRGSLVFAGIGVAITAALAFGAIRYLSGGFARGMTRLTEARWRARPADARPAAAAVVSHAWRNPLLRFWVRDPIERACFDLASASLKRDRDVRLRVYPSLAVVVILPLIGLLDRERSPFMSIMSLWFLGVAPMLVTESLRASSNPSAAEVFRAAPVRSVAPLFHGVRKAAIAFSVVPLLALCAAALIAMARNRTGAALFALPVVMAIPTLSLTSGFFGPYVPLAKPAVRGAQAARNSLLWWTTSLASAALIAATWGALRLHLFWPFVGLLAAGLVPLHRLLLRRIERMTLRPE